MEVQTKGTSANYRGLLHGILTLWKEEGFLGLYRGWIPAMLGVSHGAFQFMAYEEMRKFWSDFQREHYGSVSLSSFHFMMMGIISKVFAAVITYPYQVTRSRLQERPPKYAGLWDCCVKSWRRGGVKEFYAGLVPNVLRTVPQAAITFAAYEKFASLIS